MTTTRIIAGEEWIKHILECLRLEHLPARRIVIDAAHDSAVIVYVECFGSAGLLDVKPPAADAIDIRILE